jgi:polyisoprenoid-binding protein YceI
VFKHNLSHYLTVRNSPAPAALSLPPYPTTMRTRFALLTLLVAGIAFTGFRPADPPAAAFPAGTYAVDNSHSEVAFKVKHLGLATVTGYFRDYEATVASTSGEIEDLEFNATIQATSIDTGNDKRDDHLRSGDFFEVETYPTLTFVSTAIRNIDGDEFEIVGDLTMHGVTKSIVLEAELTGQGKDPWGGQRIAVEAEGEINRKDFGLTWNKALETGGLLVGEDVRLVLTAEAVLQDTPGTR